MAKKSASTKSAKAKKVSKPVSKDRMEELSPKSPEEIKAQAEKIAGADTFDESQIRPPELSDNAATVARVLGEVCWMMSKSKAHQYFFFADMEWMITTPIALNQFRIYRDAAGKPAGLVLWAKVSDLVEERLKAGASRLAPYDWNSGENLWIIDLVDLVGDKAEVIIRDMKDKAFKDKSFKFLVTSAEGKRTVRTVK